MTREVMTEQEKFNRIWWSAYREARRAALIEPVRLRHAWATALLWYWYDLDEPGRPDIISGFRSPRKQLMLRLRWDRGDREGLVERPACRSWHMVGRALDVESGVRGFQQYARIMRGFGMRDGRTFDDPGHFDLPGRPLPPNICQA